MKPVLALILSLILSACWEPKITTDAAQYGDSLLDWMPTGLVDHFPPSIPPAATKVWFSSYPGMMQAGSWIQLRLVLPTDHVRWIEKLAEAREQAFLKDNLTKKQRAVDGNHSPAFETSDTAPGGGCPFPAGYRIYVFHELPYKPGDINAWNHGKSCGVAIHRKAGEVVYFAEEW